MVNSYRKEYERKNRNKINQQSIDWRMNHPEQAKASQDRYEKRRKPRTNDEIKRHKEANSRRHIRNRIAVFDMYGRKCVWCGESRYELLTIDHIENNGNSHRKEGAVRICDVLVKQPYQPEKYQVLCFNCNMAKENYKILPGIKDYQPWEYWETISRRQK
jgi:hypothetical protein